MQEAGKEELKVETCRHFLAKKKRYCRLEKIGGKDHCVQHIHLISGEENTRIPCPLDPSHTCDKNNVEKHIKNCNATKNIPKEPWYVCGINSDKTVHDYDRVTSLKDVTAEECSELIRKLREILKTPPESSTEFLQHPVLSDEISESKNSGTAMKKLVQNSNLLGLMEKYRILASPGYYVEFGAGRGQLTTSILKAVSETHLPSSGFILVDRGTNRRKLDAKYRQTNTTNIIRVRADIRDLCLREIELLKPCISDSAKSPPLVGVSKHLCGSATDLTLRCIVNTSPEPGFYGGIIALCCHHRCDWVDYCGKNFFENLKFSPRDFSILTLMSSWAVCCFREKNDKQDVGLNNDVDNAKNDHNKLDFITDTEKENIGIICKHLIDQGRVEFLKSHGFEAALAEYTNKTVTLENVALVFRREKL